MNLICFDLHIANAEIAEIAEIVETDVSTRQAAHISRIRDNILFICHQLNPCWHGINEFIKRESTNNK